MPTPGVQLTDGRNPLGQKPNRWRERRHVFVQKPGQSPAVMDIDDTRVDTAAPGTIRRLWRQAWNFIPAPPPFPVSQAPTTHQRALRYKASTVYRAAGTDNTRMGARRPIVPTRHRSRPVTVAAGNLQGRPVLRNRLISFGRRVPPLNSVSPAAEPPK